MNGRALGCQNAGRDLDLREEAYFWLDFFGYFFYQEKK
jgi:hypothetical protein